MTGKLHILTDTVIQDRFSHLDLARFAAEGGADWIQYRNKSWKVDSDLTELKAIVSTLSNFPASRLIVNDLPSLAHQVGADGVHVGQEDAPPAHARSVMGPKGIVGVTIHSQEELEGLGDVEIDYIGVGPVFGTQSKDTGLPAMTLARFREFCQASPYPVIGIGGINRSNAHLVMEAGAAGVAVLSDFCTAPEPAKVAAELQNILS